MSNFKTSDFPVVEELRKATAGQMEFFNEMMDQQKRKNAMLKHATGNLITFAEHGLFDVIVHGCNCFQTMGSGIAKEIKDRYPSAYEADLDYGIKGDHNKLGNYTVMLGGHFLIINAYTQFDFNKKYEPVVDRFEYTSFQMILEKLAKRYKGCDFGFPYLGCGLAGGNEMIIVEMLEAFAVEVEKNNGTVTLVKFG